jgi:hypothetical protein
MNRIEAAIRGVMSAQNIEQLNAAAAKVGIPQSQLHKIITGKIGLSADNLKKLVLKLSDEPQDQFRILSAHLYEEIERSGFDFSRIKIQFSEVESTDIPFSDLPPILQHDMRTLGDEIINGNTDLGGTIHWLAALIDSHKSWVRGEAYEEPEERFQKTKGTIYSLDEPETLMVSEPPRETPKK